MENSNNKNILLTFIIVVFILFASFITFLFLNKDIKFNKDVKNSQNTAESISTIIDQKEDFSIKLRNINRNNEKFNYTTVEYNKDSENYILKSFFDETYPDQLGVTNYSISYLSNKYLTVREDGWEINMDYLFDLTNLTEIDPRGEEVGKVGTYRFYENDKYVLFEGIGRIMWTGLTVVFIDDKPIYNCILTREDAEDIIVKDGIISFTELALTEDGSEVKTDKSINITDFCKDK